MTQLDKTKKYNFEVYSLGVVHASVCTNMPRKEIEAHMGEHEPTGVSSGWTISKDKTFASGEPNPCPCPDKPGNKHYLMEC